MKLGKLSFGWRPLSRDEVEACRLVTWQRWRGFFIEWGDERKGVSLMILAKADPQ